MRRPSATASLATLTRQSATLDRHGAAVGRDTATLVEQWLA